MLWYEVNPVAITIDNRSRVAGWNLQSSCKVSQCCFGRANLRETVPSPT